MPSDFSNALYYTFSTIAQSLAALLGVLGAFSLYRLQRSRESLADSMSRIHGDVPGDAPKEVHQAYHEGKWARFLELVRGVKLNNSALKGPLHIELADNKLQQIGAAERSLKWIFIVGLVVITFCLLMLVATPFINSDPCVSLSCMVVGVVGSVAYMGWVFYEIFWKSGPS